MTRCTFRACLVVHVLSLTPFDVSCSLQVSSVSDATPPVVSSWRMKLTDYVRRNFADARIQNAGILGEKTEHRRRASFYRFSLGSRYTSRLHRHTQLRLPLPARLLSFVSSIILPLAILCLIPVPAIDSFHFLS